MSDTPETDAAKLQAEADCNILRPNGWNFARKLARERNNLQDQRDIAIRMAKERKRERDEAREALREIHELLQRDAAWDTPNNVSGSLVAIEHLCDWVLQKEAAK